MEDSRTHALKTLPRFFTAIVQGIKTFEIRENDRDFRVNDRLILEEWDGERYTGRRTSVRVTYMTSFEQKPGYVVMGISRLGGAA